MIRCISIVLIVCCCIASAALAQLNSPACDPNLYSPKIGNRTQCDTIYGNENKFLLGNFLHNLPDPVVPEKRMMAYAYYTTDSVQEHLRSFDPSAIFNLHKFTEKPFPINPTSVMIPGHFRSKRYLDLLVQRTSDDDAVMIYWADDSGAYSQERVSVLTFRTASDSEVVSSEYLINPYVGKFTSDTVDDIVWAGLTYVRQSKRYDTLVAGIFHGGQRMAEQPATIYPDSQRVVYFVNVAEPSVFEGVQGDFRGIGTPDYLFLRENGDVFHYKYHAPFSLTDFARSIREDTLFAAWQDPSTRNTANKGRPFYSWSKLAMQAFPKEDSDLSVDLVVPVERSAPYDMSLYFFRGGARFGSSRFILDSADFRLREPAHYDSFTFGLTSIGELNVNCGDMTGTGNNVLGVAAYSASREYGFMFFYVLGKAMDDKIDMIIGSGNSGGIYCADTLDANGDGLTDLMFGRPEYVNNADVARGLSIIGSIGILYGSKQIPVHENHVIQVVDGPLDLSVTLWPNPAHAYTNLILVAPVAGEYSIVVHDVLGRTVYESRMRFVRGEHTIRLSTLELPNGTYYVQATGNEIAAKVTTMFATEN